MLCAKLTVTPYVNTSQSFEANSVTVALEWDVKNGVFYIVSVQPETLVDYTQTNSARLSSLSYGKQYNISVTASLCGRNRTTFSVCRYSKLHTLGIILYNISECTHAVRCPNQMEIGTQV